MLESNSLWLEREPTINEVISESESIDINLYEIKYKTSYI